MVSQNNKQPVAMSQSLIDKCTMSKHTLGSCTPVHIVTQGSDIWCTLLHWAGVYCHVRLQYLVNTVALGWYILSC